MPPFITAVSKAADLVTPVRLNPYFVALKRSERRDLNLQTIVSQTAKVKLPETR
jgi:hypothetical protein